MADGSFQPLDHLHQLLDHLLQCSCMIVTVVDNGFLETNNALKLFNLLLQMGVVQAFTVVYKLLRGGQKSAYAA